MLSNFLKHFTRSLRNFWFLNSINLLGLSLAGTAAILVFLYVDHETSFDQFHEASKNIVRLEAKTNSDEWFSNLGVEHARALKNGTYPELERLTVLNRRSRAFVETNNQRFAEENIYQTSVGSAFFEMFDFPFVEGSPEQALKDPKQIVLTESTARKYFGNAPALGQIVIYDSTSYSIAGVIADLPTHTHFEFDLVVNSGSFNGTDHFHGNAYLKLYPDVNRKVLEQKILELDVAYNEYHDLQGVRLMNIGDIHLKSDVSFGASGKGDLVQIRIFQVLAILILAVAAINYVNLSFAIFLNKGKELGMRKILGETRMEIIIHLSLQAVTTALLALPFIALGLYFSLPSFEALMGIKITALLFEHPAYIFLGIGLLVLIGLLTVIYPLAAIGQISIGEMLKSKQLLNGHGGVRYRNLLMFIQFVFLFALGISAWFMNRQISYLDEKDKGFDASQVLKVQNAYDIGSYEDYQLFKNRLLSYPQIQGVAFGPMMGDGMSPLSYQTEGSEEIYENLLSYGVDTDYFEVMGIPILEGDFKTVLAGADNGQIVSLVNQSFINRFNWKSDPIGKKITLRPGTENELHRKVSAVFQDFHFFSFKEKIAPQIISLRPDPQFVNTNILVKVATPDFIGVSKMIEFEWNKIQPGLPLDLITMESAVRKMYTKERQTATVGINLSFLAIGLSIMGVLGFMVYLISIKSKEIVIRKVLGASIAQIIKLLNQQLFLAVLAAGVVGSLTSYWLLSRWLEAYAYRITLNPVAFLLSIMASYLTIMAITAYQTIRSTRVNPAVVLKEE
ncbi:MAG: ABC transporter permease [Cytophagales bacterium]|nr:ABC transporter permease [Cytophagales bacterium]